MNKLIIMINEQAIEYAHAQLNDIAVENKGSVIHYTDLHIQKFAELISYMKEFSADVETELYL